jgi:hypothetical protein
MREDALYKELAVSRAAGIFEVQIFMLNNSGRCISDSGRGLDLLTTYRSELQITITLLLSSTLQITQR